MVGLEGVLHDVGQPRRGSNPRTLDAGSQNGNWAPPKLIRFLVPSLLIKGNLAPPKISLASLCLPFSLKGIGRPRKFLLEKHSSPRGHGKTGWAPPCPPQDPTKTGYFVRCSFNEPMVFLKQSAPWARGNNSLAGQ